MSHTKLAILFLAVVASALADNKILVLTDGSNMQVSHSQFFGNMRKAGFDVTFKPADDASLQLVEYGVNVYDHVAIFAPNADEFGGDLSSQKIAEYVDNGGNVLIALDTRVTDTVRSTCAEFGVETDTEGTFVIDHFNYSPELDFGDRTVLSLGTDKYYSSAKPFTPKKDAPDSLLYQGIGMVINGKNNLVSSVLTAPSTAYSWSPEKPVTAVPMMIGKEITLVSALEARNNARVLIVGSVKFFSDEYAEANDQHARQLGLWAFQRAGVLRLSNMQHYESESKQTLETYTIFDMLTFKIDVHEKNEETGDWKVAHNDDIQVEWTRIDPFVLQYLKKEGANSAVQSLEFKIPHVYGVFKFIIDYKRVGYTYLQLEETVPVRPLVHTQYERFIVAAYPYYAGAGSMLVGLFLFSFVFLYHN